MNTVNGSDEVNKMKIPLEFNVRVVFFKETKLTEDLKKGDVIYWWNEFCIVTGECILEEKSSKISLIEVIPYSNILDETDEYIYSGRHDGCKSYICAGVDIPVVKHFVPLLEG